MMSTPDCEICGSTCELIAKKIRHIGDCNVFYCRDCDVSVLEDNFRYKKNEKAFYNDLYVNNLNTTKGEAPIEIIKKRVERCQEYLDEKGSSKILEIGAAGGHFLNLLKKQGHDVLGIDLIEDHCKYAKENYQIEIKNIDFFEFDENEKYDFIFLFQLLEHISKPKDFFKKIDTLLNDGGYIIFDVPNINDALFKLYKIPKIVDSFFFKYQHPFTYSEKGLKKMLDLFNFKSKKIELIQCYSITNHLNWIYQNTGNTSFIEGMRTFFSNSNICDENYREMWSEINSVYKRKLVERGFSDMIFAVFQKQ